MEQYTFPGKFHRLFSRRHQGGRLVGHQIEQRDTQGPGPPAVGVAITEKLDPFLLQEGAGGQAFGQLDGH